MKWPMAKDVAAVIQSSDETIFVWMQFIVIL